MDIGLYCIIGILVLSVSILLVKIYLLQKSAREIREAFADKLVNDTNTLIDISGNDKYMRDLANDINDQLQKLRNERRRYQQGDMELKIAVTNISHDLRTPLTAICGYLDLLEQEDKSETVGRYIGVIRNRSEMLKQLTEELFRYSVIVSTENDITNEPMIINQVLEESIAAFYADLKEHNINPNIQMPEKNVNCSLDRSALSRVFANLLSNAIKYSDGDLDIKLSEEGEIIFTNTVSRLNEVQVEKLFHRFYTVETARNSTGLGLAIARTLVEQMNGRITAQYTNKKLSICVVFAEVKYN